MSRHLPRSVAFRFLRPLCRGGAIGSLLVVCGCAGSGEVDRSGVAELRFVEVSPGAGEMDFYVNGAGAAYNVGFASFTSYLEVSSGSATITASRAGSGQTLLSVESPLVGGHRYTAVVSHHLGNLQGHVYEDLPVPVTGSQLAVRVLNATEGLGTMSVYIARAGEGEPATHPLPMMLHVPSGGASAYVPLPADASYAVTATATEAGLSVPVSTVTVRAANTAAQTVVFAGAAQGGAHDVVGFALNDAERP